MREELFRKKVLDKVKSPDNLHEYIRVSSPSIWLILVSVILLLVGMCVWGFFGHVDSTISSLVRIENEEAVCFVDEEYIDFVEEGMAVEYDDHEAVIETIGNKQDEEYKCELIADSYPKDGWYKAKIIVKRFKPISFVLN